ncbi:DMT family transporter [Campylobacter sp. 19-13652]|uniref:DMT family transporter n=1 Tax=Campylobacter sp. 19-13652 TaxID=2840180 RepID=UPI001C77C9CB|nr:DMT family transporter [Campylobacter sp. 19-13652]BCX78842.1 membrane protein [Campylobacter sp. 19-13652]
MGYFRGMEFRADLALFVIAIMWGVTFLPMAEALKTNGVFTILFYRFSIATLLMLVILLKMRHKFDKPSFYRGVALGVLLFFGFWTQTEALKYTFSSTVAFITGLNVIFTPFIVLVLFKDRLSVYALVGAFLAAFGLYYLSAAELGVGLGEVLSTACAIFYSFEIIFAGRFVRKYNLYTLVITELFVVAVLSFFGAFFTENRAIAVWDSVFINTLIITSFFATFVAFLVQNWAQKFTSSAKTSLILTFEPVSAGFIGYFWGAEMLTSTQLMGAGLIMLGILISELGGAVFSKKASDKK